MQKLLLVSSAAYLYSKMNNQKHQDLEGDETARQGICVMKPEENETAKGVVRFEQKNLFSKTHIQAEFSGLTPGQKHAFHIH